MKVRMDFVTNSSSSSYVIAIKNDYTESALAEMLKKEFDLAKFVKEYGQYVEDTTFKYLSDEQKVDFVADEVASDLMGSSYYNPVEIEGWKIHAEELGSEDCYLLGMFIYCFAGGFDKEFIKVRGFS